MAPERKLEVARDCTTCGRLTLMKCDEARSLERCSRLSTRLSEHGSVIGANGIAYEAESRLQEATENDVPLKWRHR